MLTRLIKKILGLLPVQLPILDFGGGDNPEEDPTSLRSTAFMEIVEVISEGVIEGFETPADIFKSIYFDDTPVRTAGGQSNFETVYFNWNQGAVDQAYIPAHLDDGNATATPVGVLVRNDQGGITRITTVPEVDRVRVVIDVPQLVRTDSTGDIRSTTVTLAISVRPSGAQNFIPIDLGGRETIAGKTTSLYSRSYIFRVSDLGPAPYEIRVQRVTPDSTSAKIVDEIYWSSYTEIVDAKLRYPGSAMVKVMFDAEKFSRIPVRGYQIKGIIIQVPTNYDPATRVYTGPWDGSFKYAWTDNPAWIFYDLATNPRYGLGDFIDSTMVNKGALYTIGQYCDELVDDGFGGVEPRFCCSVYLQKSQDAYKVLTDLASIFRGMVYWTNSELYCVQDAPKAATAQYTPANVVDGAFSYTGASKAARPTIALVRWNDPQDGYRPAIEYVEDRDGIARFGPIERTVNAIGCLSRAQAHRMGKYVILTGIRETDVVSFKAGMDTMFCLPGDIIKVFDPLKSSAYSMAGRITEVAGTNSIVLDREVVLSGGETYTATILKATGELIEAAVSSAAGTYPAGSSIVLGTSFAAGEEPIEGAIWSIRSDLINDRLYRVLSIEELTGDDDGFYQVSATRYDPSKLPDVDSTDSIGAIPDPPIDYTGIQPVSSLVLAEGVYVVDGVMRRYIDASWQPSPGPYLESYAVVWRKPDGQTYRYETIEPDYRVENPGIGEHSITVYARDIAGRLSTGVAASITIEELPPIASIIITGLELEGQGADTDFVGRDPTFAWRATSLLAQEIGDETLGGDTGLSDPWLQDFQIDVYDETGTLLRSDHSPITKYTYFYSYNVEDSLPEGPNRTLRVIVAARDKYNRLGIPAAITVTNPPPTDFRSLEINTGFESIYVSYFPPLDPDYVATRVYLSTIQDFAPGPDTLAYEGSLYTIPLLGLTERVYFLRIEGVDEFGPAGEYSNEFRVEITSVQVIFDELAGKITESWLYQTLQERIDLIDGFGPGSVNERIDAIETTGIQTFYQPAPPTDQEANDGDLWFDTDDNNHPYIYDITDTTLPYTHWKDAQDTSVTGTNNYFADGPTGPTGASFGDLWFDTRDLNTDGLPDNIPYYWDGVDWINIRDGMLLDTASQVSNLSVQVTQNETDITANAVAITAVETTVIQHGTDITANANAIQTLQVSVQGKTSVYYQDTAPTPPSGGFVDGDIWIETDNNNFTWVWQTNQWVDARDTSASGNATYFTDVAGIAGLTPAAGDILIVSDMNNAHYRWDPTQPAGPEPGSQWVPVSDGSVAGANTIWVFVDPPWPDGVNDGDLLFDGRDNDGDGLADNIPYRWNDAGQTWQPIGANYLVASIEEEKNARINADDTLSAEWTLKIDVNGFVAGIGLAVSGGGSGPILSEFLVRADQFAIAKPANSFQSGLFYLEGMYVRPSDAYILAVGNTDGIVHRCTQSGVTAGEPAWPTIPGITVVTGGCSFISENITNTVPFIVGTVNGSPAVVMNKSFIADATIGQAQIFEADITHLDSVIIEANQISTGTLQAGVEIEIGGPQFKLLADDRKMVVTDDQTFPVDRVEIGRLGLAASDYGLVIRDENGDVILSSGRIYHPDIANDQQQWNDISGPGAPDLKLVNSTDWVPQTIGSQPNWDIISGSLSSESAITLVGSPYDLATVPVWNCRPSGDGDWDGGFQHVGFTMDPAKTYRYTTWVYRTGDDNGNLLWGPKWFGTDPANVAQLGTGDVQQGNPYFGPSYANPAVVVPQKGKWFLLVGMIYTQYYTGTTDNVSGLYDPDTNGRVIAFQGFKWRSIASFDSIRAGLFNAGASTGNRVYFFNPTVYEANGSEPSLVALLDAATVGAIWADITGVGKPADNADVTADNPQTPDWINGPIIYPDNPITPANISTFIQAAAIDEAYIGSTISSYTYLPASGIGWRIDRNGFIDCCGLNIRRTGTGEIMLSTDGTIMAQLDNQQQDYADIIGAKPSASLINMSSWVPGTNGSQPGFNHVGNVSENSIVLRGLPTDNVSGYVWQGVSDQTGVPPGNADGGWNTDPFDVDPTKVYRFSVFVRHTNGITANSGNVYLGCEGNKVRNNETGLADSNPYFMALPWSSIPGVVSGRWYLLVGYVLPYTTLNSAVKIGGVYDTWTGNKIMDAQTTFRWFNAAAISSYHRCFWFYALEANHTTQFWSPKVEILEGAEKGVVGMLDRADATAFNAQDYNWVTGTIGVDKPPADADKTADNTALNVIDQSPIATNDNVPIDGIYIKNLTVGTLHVIDNSITKPHPAGGAQAHGTALPADPTWSVATETATFSVYGNYPVLIHASVPFHTASFENSWLVRMAVERWHSVTGTWALVWNPGWLVVDPRIPDANTLQPAGQGHIVHTFSWYDPSLSVIGAGNVRYRLVLQKEQSFADVYFEQPYLSAMEVMK